ncbi:cysteine and tyrosine-rich protein 1-like [Ruditapes philippinarum]|uniref:cysteine and tyrosine-rich protein 1-like n=1 Tax=Ruditapes philippinarum TaxID=129788 RepID=UPI00295A5C16|nr:cysteine and tyrosine-rich protein 1-like [Ruditapes philippinarum]
MKNALILFLFGVTNIKFGGAWDYCRNNGENGGYIYCETDCCGSWPYEKCCDDRAWLGWAIAGGVIGGILLISLIVCVVCVCIKQNGKTGRIVQPQPVSTVSYITNNPQNQAFQTQYVTIGFSQQSSAPGQPPPAYPSAPDLLPAYHSAPDLPPAYQSLYGQQQQQQHPPPLPPSLQGRQQQQQQQNTLTPIGFEGR